jgi:hypothetical protein
MSWAIGEFNGRDIGYGVPAICDHPGCGASIDRGLSYMCGGDVYGGEHGCGLFFCSDHLQYAAKRRDGRQLCSRCYSGRQPFEPTPDTPEWVKHKLTHRSWATWRAENKSWVRAQLENVSHG